MDCAIQRLNNLEQNNRNKRFIRFTFRPAQVFFKTLSIESGIEPVSLQLCSQALYRMRLAQVKNSPRANVFPAGDANLMQVMCLSIERSPQDTWVIWLHVLWRKCCMCSCSLFFTSAYFHLSHCRYKIILFFFQRIWCPLFFYFSLSLFLCYPR